MATYFHGATEIQGGDALQTLYLMNPSYAAAAGGYSDAPAQANMSFFMNNSQNPMSLSPGGGQAHQQTQQHFVGIPLHPAADSGARQATTTHDLSAIHQGLHYNLWTPTPASNRPLQHGLSLSLSSQQQQQQQQQQQAAPYAETKIVGSSSSPSSAAAAAASSNGMIGVQSVFMGSKYLKTAQQLLDEVVNVGKGGKLEQMTKLGREINDERRRAMKRDKDAEGAGGGGSEGDCGTKRGEVELTTAERQELQMKKAKLANMLDEVEQRYRQYHHQMQMVVSSFETVAGFGSARTYTALALQTMSKQFRCLRDAISGQIKATCKSLGEEDCLGGGGGKSVGSRLRFVDHHLRQQRALQQLGTAQYNAWRPQRGLPERAVSVLRAWLFEHFLHPYPKDSDKHMLAKETGLTRSQVSNWFINARVRLWKPMVEEMYVEETKEQEQNTGDDQKTSKSDGSEHSASRSTSNHGQSPARTESFKQNQDSHPMRIQPSNLGIFDNRHNNDDDDSFMQQRLKKARTDEPLHRASMLNPVSHEMKQQDDMSNRDLMMKFMDHGGGFGAYQIEQFDNEQFAPSFGGNGVSLTLGLPHCEPLPLSGSQQPTYLSNETIPLGRRLDIGMGSEEINYFSLNNNSDNNPSASHPPNATYESINIQNRRRFAAQLLPDYVA